MLSMSQMGGANVSNTPSPSSLSSPMSGRRGSAGSSGRLLSGKKKKISHHTEKEYEDIEEQLNSCYNDDNFVYPELDMSDEEEKEVKRKPGAKVKKDGSWNPTGTETYQR